MTRSAGASAQAAFRRDLLRDFCLVNAALSGQRKRLGSGGSVSYHIFSELIGRGMLKGVFWRLKDTAHQLFRRNHESSDSGPSFRGRYDTRMSGTLSEPDVESMLDWCIGYAFHECVRLKESAYQNLHYTAKLAGAVNSMPSELIAPLVPLVEETEEILRCQLERTLGTLGHAGLLLIRYLGAHDENPYIARFLLEFETLATETFGERMDELLRALYGEQPERRYVLAARACLEGGRLDKAMAALDSVGDSFGEEAGELRLTIQYALDCGQL